MLRRNHGTVAYRAAAEIRKYWKYEDAYFQPEVTVNPETYEIMSNMRNGWPPKRSV